MHRPATFWLAFLLVPACGGRSADFGTLPRVEVPIEKQPAQDPTLFHVETKQVPLSQRTDPEDPTPLRLLDHFDIALKFDKGEVSVVSMKPVHLTQPQSTVRRMGRFAFELWSGEQLIDRVRFDFPLLGASSANEEDLLGKGLSSSTSIRVPAASRATTARILDRKTREEVDVPWPPPPNEPASETPATSAP